jgi:hypothetical protein
MNIQTDIVGDALFDAGLGAGIGQMMPSFLHEKKGKVMVGLAKSL